MKGNWYPVAAAFFGATVALIVAKYFFAATGTETPRAIAFVGFVASFGAHLIKSKSKVKAHG